MDARRIKAEQIVRQKGITKTQKGWIVPSQSGRGTYLVQRREEALTCTCPDYQLRNQACKHVLAVQILTLSWFDHKGNKILELKRVSYPQDWSAYNVSQTTEKDTFMELLADLCSNVDEKAIPLGRAGRHGLSRKDAIFVSALKVYTTFSLRRFVSDMRIAKERDLISAICSYSSVSNYMRDPELTPILNSLITLSALPLKSVESTFAIDSSGFRTTKFNDYCRETHETNQEHNWVKLHICVGTKTNNTTKLPSSTIDRPNALKSSKDCPLVFS